VRVGDDPASVWYERQISRAFGRHGLAASPALLPDGSDEATLIRHLAELGADDGTHAILLQLPLPPPLKAETIVEHLPLDKDLEGLHPYHVGRLALGRPTFIPSTPLAGLELLRRSAIEPAGQLAVIVGRSVIIGRPLASLLVQANATVVTCHTRTPDLAALTRQADLLLAAAGRPGLVDGTMVKPGATVVDFGTTEVDGRLVGDVDFDSTVEVAGALTPVPGGVGPLTIAMLARNLLQAARRETK
jgi:methylenetetrahydrofolate dehydrogenase (NADP+)/methenyltetrahydrofolate cyclohydrolase